MFWYFFVLTCEAQAIAVEAISFSASMWSRAAVKPGAAGIAMQCQPATPAHLRSDAAEEACHRLRRAGWGCRRGWAAAGDRRDRGYRAVCRRGRRRNYSRLGALSDLLGPLLTFRPGR